MRGTDDNGTSIAGEVHEKPLVSESINRGDMDGRKEKKKDGGQARCEGREVK